MRQRYRTHQKTFCFQQYIYNSFQLIKIGRVSIMFMVAYVLISCASTSKVKETETAQSNTVNFRTSGKVPLIEVSLNGKPAYFIVDTGASVSIVNESEASHYNFKIHNMSASTDVMGFGGSSTLNLAVNCSLEIGSMKIKNVSFRSKDMANLAAVIAQTERVRLAGILGSDVFSKYRMNIDYATKTISCQVL